MTRHWLDIRCGEAPLIVCFPHGGTDLTGFESAFRSEWLARMDTDWWISGLYAFAGELGATTIATSISRSVIDVNRDPSGQSLYPGQATTELCPMTTFDGMALYRAQPPDDAEIGRRRKLWFDPYHAALRQEIERLQSRFDRIVVYDAHSIRSRVPRLFDGKLPVFNVGTNGGASCSAQLADALARICRNHGESHVIDGRFKGGWTTRRYGAPAQGIEAIQVELAMRAYMQEPETANSGNWPAGLDLSLAQPTIAILREFLIAALAIATR